MQSKIVPRDTPQFWWRIKILFKKLCEEGQSFEVSEANSQMVVDAFSPCSYADMVRGSEVIPGGMSRLIGQMTNCHSRL